MNSPGTENWRFSEATPIKKWVCVGAAHTLLEHHCGGVSSVVRFERVPHDRRDEVLQSFRRLSGSQPSKGVGLGLAVTRGSLDAMGNELLIEDTLAVAPRW